MTAPTAPIDADLVETSNDEYYILEQYALWRTGNLMSAGAATWTKVLDAAATGAAFGLVGLQFHRVRAVGGYVQVLASANSTTPGYINAYLFRSSSGGIAWYYKLIAENVGGELPFTLEPGEPFEASNASSSIVAGRFADGTGGTMVFAGSRTGTQQYPSITNGSWLLVPKPGQNTAMSSCKVKVAGVPMNTVFSDSDTPADQACRPRFWNGDFEEYSSGSPAEPTKSNVYEYSGLTPATITSVVFYRAHRGDSRNDGVLREYNWLWQIIEWNGIPLGKPNAFDVARTNPDYIYVGLPAKVVATTDGGATWTVLDDTVGANDLAVHPAAAGVVTCWDTEGNLIQYIAGVKQATPLLTEVPKVQFGRIAYDANAFLFVLQSGSSLQARRNGSFVELKSGIAMGRSLRAYTGGRIGYLDNNGIWFSDDNGVTFDDKTGDYGWEEPVSLHVGRDL